MPTLNDLARQIARRDHTFSDLVREVFDPSKEIGAWRAEKLRMARESFIDFVEVVYPHFEINWHHRVIAAHLEDLADGKIKRLLIETPPRCTKTAYCSHLFPAWTLGRQDEAIVSAAYNRTKAADEAQSVKAIFDGEAYRAIFPLAQIPQRTNESRHEYRRAGHFNLVGRRGAVYRAAGIGGGLTGYSKSLGIIDDPIKSLEDAYSERQREKVWSWYSSVYRARDTRLIAGERGVRDLVVMTPWHDDDLQGRILAQEPEDWHVLRLPAFLTDATMSDADDDDPRQVGESIWPAMWSTEALQKFQRAHPSTFQALFQCRPSAAGGSTFVRQQFLDHTYVEAEIPGDGFFQLSIDATFGSEKETSSYVAIQLWCFTPDNHALLIEAWRGHWSYPRTLAQIEAILVACPQVDEILIEEKANGSALVQMLRQRNRVPVNGISPRDSKMVRAIAISPWVVSGNVRIPARETEWREEFLSEVCLFPRGKSDDQVDAMSQALLRLNGNPTSELQQWGTILGLR